jgi:hypothetical protein
MERSKDEKVNTITMYSDPADPRHPCYEMWVAKKCLKEFNPKHFPGLYWGSPWEYRDFLGCCCDCQVEKRMREEERERKANVHTSDDGSGSEG